MKVETSKIPYDIVSNSGDFFGECFFIYLFLFLANFYPKNGNLWQTYFFSKTSFKKNFYKINIIL